MSIEAQVQQSQSLEATGDIEGAVQILLSLNFESAQRTYADVLKMQTYLKAAELCLHLNKIEEAEIQVNRASMLQTSVSDEELVGRYKSLYAVVLNFNARFVEAATRYYELSLKNQLSNEDKTHVLQEAVICTILAPRSQQKNRLLMNLFKDERCCLLPGYNIVKEMYFERFIKKAQEFREILKPHQKKVENGMSLLEQAIIEHNILSLARIYKCITFINLEQLLQVPSSVIEKMVTRMISANLFRATIDQIDGLVTFEAEEMDLDQYIVSVCDQVSKINELIASKHPDWHKERSRMVNGTTL